MSILLLMDDDGPPFPRSLFSAGEQGIWLDPSDFSTLFQDAAGTTPVTALGQPVGLALDKRLGLVLSANDFPVTTTTLTGWTVGENVTGVSSNGAGITFTGGGDIQFISANWLRPTSSAAITRYAFYEIKIKARHISGAGDLQVGISYNKMRAITAASNGGVLTEYTVRGFADSAAWSNTFSVGAIAGGTWYIEDVRTYPILGNHAYQTTLAARQTAQSNYLSLDKTDDHLLVAAGGAGTTGFLLVAGIMVPAAGTARTLWSDRGTNTGYKVGIDASNQIFLSAGNGAAFVTATGPALVAGTKYVVTAWHDGANLNISVNNGAPTQAAFVTATAGTATITIGKANASATEYWGDRIYSMVYRKNDTSNAGQRSSLYSYMVGKMGGL